MNAGIDLERLDRRWIYLLVFLALSVPILTRYTVQPARMSSAERFFEVVEGIEAGPERYAFVAMDFGPSTQGENRPQARAVVEHLMRKRIPVIVFSLYYLADPFLKAVPEEVARELEREHPGETWEYGRDWINLGYRPGAGVLIQAIPKSENLAELFGKDVRGNRISDLPAFSGLRTLRQISFLAEFTGLVGVFDNYVQYFTSKDYTPAFGHGCTSITIPEAFIYLDSGQIQGLLGGIAGAAWYSELLNRRYPQRPVDESFMLNTGLGVAQLVVIAFIILGNLAGLMRWSSRPSTSRPSTSLRYAQDERKGVSGRDQEPGQEDETREGNGPGRGSAS